MDHTSKKSAGGRPPKFNEARRPVIVTLPERMLKLLEAINPDRAKAIVKITDMMTDNGGAHKSVELIEIMPNKSMILVGPSASLRSIPWLRLVEVAPMRYLLVLPSGMAAESLELAILDVLERLKDRDARERDMLEALRRIICRHRRDNRISRSEILFFEPSGADG